MLAHSPRTQTDTPHTIRINPIFELLYNTAQTATPYHPGTPYTDTVVYTYLAHTDTHTPNKH